MILLFKFKKSSNIEYISLFSFNKDNVTNETIKQVINEGFNNK